MMNTDFLLLLLLLCTMLSIKTFGEGVAVGARFYRKDQTTVSADK